MRDTRKYRVCAAYDTETTNIGDGADTRAFPVLFICNDLRCANLRTYDYSTTSDVRFYRETREMLDYIDDLITWGAQHNTIPIIAAYNLMFDLQPLLFELSKKYELRANAQTATNAYTLDIYISNTIALRFWDTFFLEMNGLRAMGEICGLPKADGDWDYTLVRTPETPLTEREKHYAARDTQVIPAYLRYLLEANEWLTPEMLGSRVITKTSLVRQMAKNDLTKRRYRNRRGHSMSLGYAFAKTCEQEFPLDFETYALRKACFRGGLTFTSANFASRVMHNVASLDVTSMHHTFINGRMLPVHFKKCEPEWLEYYTRRIMCVSVDDALRFYHRPFDFAFHARIELSNLRVRKKTVFERCGIGLLSEGKFSKTPVNSDIGEDERAKTAEAQVKLAGWRDMAVHPVFAFGKLMSAERVVLHVNEVEWWCINQVYEFDVFHVKQGEATQKYTIPPDYVTLQSNLLFERKQTMKHILKVYRQGNPYPETIPDIIPEGIRRELENGTADVKFLESYYNSTVKGQFNGIYGTQAMDLMRPNFTVTMGEIKIDTSSVVTADTFDDLKPKKINVLYTYGMRIVAGSRMHLIIALELLERVFGNRATPTGGDTDSIKVSLSEDVTDEMITRALKPLADASDEAISFVQRRNRERWPDLASTLDGIGHFDIEDCGGSTRWSNHMEAWNKARISESNGKTHITCAGLSRPRDAYHVENWCDDMLAVGYDFETVAQAALGYNAFVTHDVSHGLQKHRPFVAERFRGKVTDYLGQAATVDIPQSIALYPCGRWLGETTKWTNVENLRWLKSRGLELDTSEKWISVDESTAKLQVMNENGDFMTLMEAKRNDK